MKLFIGVCNSQDYVPSEFFWSMMALKKPSDTQFFRSTHPWDVVRNNVIIDAFLKSGCDVLAKMDVDQTYQPDYFERLLPLVEKYKVAGPLIFDRWEQNKFMPLAFDEVNENLFPIKLMDLTGKTGVIEVPYPHTNLLYHREVFDKVHGPWYQAYARPDGLSRINHVDYSFLKKINDAGYKIMIDLDCVVGHLQTRFIGRKDSFI